MTPLENSNLSAQGDIWGRQQEPGRPSNGIYGTSDIFLSLVANWQAIRELKGTSWGRSVFCLTLHAPDVSWDGSSKKLLFKGLLLSWGLPVQRGAIKEKQWFLQSKGTVFCYIWGSIFAPDNSCRGRKIEELCSPSKRITFLVLLKANYEKPYVIIK